MHRGFYDGLMQNLRLSVVTEQITRLAELGQALHYRAGQVLFYVDHVPYGVFILQSGELQFEHGDKPCQEGHLSPSPLGQVVCLEHFYSHAPYQCSCQAKTDCELIFVPKSVLETA